MKKSLFLAAVLSAVLLPAFSVEWGGIFKNNSKISSNFKTASFKQSDSIYLWSNQYLNKDGSLYASEEILFKFDYYSSYKIIVNTVDIDLLKITGDFELEGSNLFFGAGRFIANDLSNVVFAQNCDGLSVKYTLPLVEFSMYAGYTGLLNSNAVVMLDSDGTSFAPANKVYALSHRFVPLSAGVSFPVLFGNQSIELQGNAFIDLAATDKSRYYGEFKISGPIANSVYYNVVTVLGSESFKNLTNYTAVDFYYFPIRTVMVDGGIEWASGDEGIFKPFTGITSRPVCNSAAYPETSGVLAVKAVAGVSLKDFYISGTGKVVMPSALSYSVKGFEADVSASYNIFTDLKVGLDATVFVDLKDSTDNNFTATLRVALAF